MKKILKEALSYIDNYWDRIIRFTPEDKDTLIGLPYPYVVPNDEIFREEMYYWDSYFTILGLISSGRKELAKGMVENCFYLIDRFGFVPNGNRKYYLTRSQPPFLTSMIKEIFKIEKDIDWLRRAVNYVKKEYNFWNSPPHKTSTGLSRYYDKSNTHIQTENESGWDLTCRFLKRAKNFIPICLNFYLYKYEKDLSDFFKILKNKKEEVRWRELANKRKRLINHYLWDAEIGLFFDYDFINKKKSKIYTSASYISLWCSLADKRQAKKMVSNLSLFEKEGGVCTTDKDYGMPDRQWNYPNGWPPVVYMIIEGLKDYGYKEEGERIKRKWIDTQIIVFEKTGLFWEKYDVVKRWIGTDDKRYKTQSGFGWTNSLFLVMVNPV